MLSYKNNFVIVMLMVFYSIMNLDNAYCFKTREECISNMRYFCQFNVEDAFECAKSAIITYPLNGTQTPQFVIQYFSTYVNPFISTTETSSSDSFCQDEVFGPENLRSLLRTANPEDRRKIELIKNSCTDTLAFLRGRSLQNIIIKDDMFTQNPYEKQYLKLFAGQIKPNNQVQGERKTPIEYCQVY